MDEQTPATTEQEGTKANVKKKEKKSRASKSKIKAKAQDSISPPEAPEQAQEPEENIPPIRTLDDLYMEVFRLRKVVLDHTQQIAELQSRPKRIMAHGGKVQIRDKETGTIYPSKNNTYQSMLKAGELQELVDNGIFGPIPEKNNFGWFALVRAWPDRFEEVKSEDKVN